MSLALRFTIKNVKANYSSSQKLKEKLAKLQIIKEDKEKKLKEKLELKQKAFDKKLMEKNSTKKIKTEKHLKEKDFNATSRERIQKALNLEKERKKLRDDKIKLREWKLEQKEKSKKEFEVIKEKAKKKRDPNQPKRARTAFIWFFTQTYADYKDTPHLQRMKAARDKFQSLSDEEKAPFNLLAQQDSLRYQTQRNHYLAGKKSHKPKRAISGYIRFANDNRDTLRSQNPSLKMKDILKLIGEKWKNTSKEVKEKYQKQYELEKESLKVRE